MIASTWGGIYFFAIALVLALLEIQIEGPDGWAARLPTWRWDSPAVRRWLGKPVTGYHVLLNLFILLLLHLPVLQAGLSWNRESEILSLYFILCVSWDFLWFVCNPHFGLRRFKPEYIWWFKDWWMGIPLSYWGGILVSAAVWILPVSPELRSGRAASWGLLFLKISGLMTMTMMVTTLRRSPPRPDGSCPKMVTGEEDPAGR